MPDALAPGRAAASASTAVDASAGPPEQRTRCESNLLTKRYGCGGAQCALREARQTDNRDDLVASWGIR